MEIERRFRDDVQTSKCFWNISKFERRNVSKTIIYGTEKIL